jgi:uncharacterized repeat protein (TIGR03803 family)
MTRQAVSARIRRAIVAAVVGLVLVPGVLAITSGKEYKFKAAPDGTEPSSGLISDGLGNFYGTTIIGGETIGNTCSAGGCGTVFMVSRNQAGVWAKTLIYKFTGGTDGAFPQGNLTFDGTGGIYGTATRGGVGQNGTVFSLTPNQDGTWTENTLYSFTGGADGGQPATGVILDQVGNLYGTTLGGGICTPFCNGIVFELTPSNGKWTETTLYSFTDGGSANPSGLVFDVAGNIYGTTGRGGSAPCICGTVFELMPNQDGTSTESVLYTFTDGLDGGTPSSGLTFDSVGNLYGEAYFGGSFACPTSGCGVVFQLSAVSGGGWKYGVVHTFSGLNGSKGEGPIGGLALDASGDVYGTTNVGGDAACGCGTIFKLSVKAGGGFNFNMIASFNGANGSIPVAGVIVDTAGNLYGTASQGGDLSCSVNFSRGCGVVFTISP